MHPLRLINHRRKVLFKVDISKQRKRALNRKKKRANTNNNFFKKMKKNILEKLGFAKPLLKPFFE